MGESASINALGQVGAEPQRAVVLPDGKRLISVRVAPGGYVAAFFVLNFLVALLLEFDVQPAALTLFLCTWSVIPFLAFTDRVAFDGRFVFRKGLVPFLLHMLGGRAQRLAIDDVESVVTMAVRTFRTAGRVRYRYRSEVTGRGREFVFASGGRHYRQMVRTLFVQIAACKLDVRSCELRDFLVEPEKLKAKVELLHLVSADVLSDAEALGSKRLKPRRAEPAKKLINTDESDQQRGSVLGRAANELRVAGRWRQAAESFRRALILQPGDSWLLFEFGRFLRSHGNAMRDAKMLKRSLAALRLAARRCNEDPWLLTRVGESFFEFGEPERAARLFKAALDVDARQYRAELGLAELALREGKLAHVIHNYGAATRVAPDNALARFARREADYYSHLNDDDDYLASELRRINWLQHVTQARRVGVRATAAGLTLALIGPLIDDGFAVAGWALACAALSAWFMLLIAGRILVQRNQYRLGD